MHGCVNPGLWYIIYNDFSFPGISEAIMKTWNRRSKLKLEEPNIINEQFLPADPNKTTVILERITLENGTSWCGYKIFKFQAGNRIAPQRSYEILQEIIESLGDCIAYRKEKIKITSVKHLTLINDTHYNYGMIYNNIHMSLKLSFLFRKLTK